MCFGRSSRNAARCDLTAGYTVRLEPVVTPTKSLAGSLVALLAMGAGLCAASLYYNQPILNAVAEDFGVSAADVGLVPMMTQLGYALGILLFAPVGDRLERRSVIVVKTVGLAGALLVAAFSPNLEMLVLSSLLIGLLATAAQDYVPAAATLAPAAERGKTVGKVMTGLLLGILLSRVVSGTVAERFGWRLVFQGAAVAVVGLAVLTAVRLPRIEPSTSASYRTLLRSMASLVRTIPQLRRAALVQGLLSLSFSAFWSTLALGLAAPPFGLGSSIAGAFGIIGAAGALIAPLAGSIADRRGPRNVIRMGALATVAAFAAMAIAPGSIVVLVIGTILFDLGVQACLISNQTIIYSLEPSARSRLNALLVSTMFLAMSAGAALASRAFSLFGWRGVTVVAATSAVAALLVSLSTPRQSS